MAFVVVFFSRTVLNVGVAQATTQGTVILSIVTSPALATTYSSAVEETPSASSIHVSITPLSSFYKLNLFYIDLLKLQYI